MTSSFLSTENKALVWGLLQEANAFINIPDTYFDRARGLYERIINEINMLADKSLKEKNKLVIMKMLEQLPFLKQNNLQKPLEEVKVEVDKNFKDRQEEFMQLVSHKAPKQANFDEEADTPLGTTELNTKLNEMMAARNHDVPTQPAPTNNTQTDNLVELNENPLDDAANSANKNVSFTTDRLLNKLKRVEPENTEVTSSQLHGIVNTIETNQRITLANQDKIIGLLTQLTDRLVTEPLDENTLPLNKIGAQLTILITKLTDLETVTREKRNARA